MYNMRVYLYDMRVRMYDLIVESYVLFLPYSGYLQYLYNRFGTVI